MICDDAIWDVPFYLVICDSCRGLSYLAPSRGVVYCTAVVDTGLRRIGVYVVGGGVIDMLG